MSLRNEKEGVSPTVYDSKDASSLETASIDSGEKPVFDTAGTSHEFYKPIASYEGIHRWDPDFKWSAPEETKLIKRVRCISSQLNR